MHCCEDMCFVGCYCLFLFGSEHKHAQQLALLISQSILFGMIQERTVKRFRVCSTGENKETNFVEALHWSEIASFLVYLPFCFYKKT